MSRVGKSIKVRWKWLAFYGSFIVIVFQFQNCGKTGFENKGLGASGKLETASNVTPFAYDPSVDTISYDSCFGTNVLSSSSHFTIKAGAYDKGGVGLTQSYMSHALDVLKPEYPNSEVTVEQLKRYTAASDTNKGAQIQMAIRAKSNPDMLLAVSADGAVEGADFVSVMGSLTNDTWMHSIFSLSAERTSLSLPTKHFPLAEGGSDLLEGALRMQESDIAASTIRDYLSGSKSFLFSLTFTASGTDEAVGEPYEARKTSDLKAFGRGYKLSFATIGNLAEAQRPKYHIGQVPKPNVPPNLLATVAEFDLQNPAQQLRTTWDCPGELKLVVIDEAHLATNPDLCPEMDFVTPSEALNSTDLNFLAIARRHLRPNEWRINIKKGCAVPLGGDLNRCYSEQSGNQADTQYSAAENCYSYVNKDFALSRVCANYISICMRLN